MAAGKITVDVEARVAKLEAQLKKAEEMVAASTGRMSAESQVAIGGATNKAEKGFLGMSKGMSKLAKGALKTAGVIGLVSVAVENIQVPLRALSTVAALAFGDIQTAGEEVHKLGLAIGELPLIGTAGRTIFGWWEEWTGEAEKARKHAANLLSQEEARLERVKQRVALSRQADKSKAATASLRDELELLKETNVEERALLKIRQDRARLMKEFVDSDAKLMQVGGKAYEAREALKEEVRLRKEILEVTQRQTEAEQHKAAQRKMLEDQIDAMNKIIDRSQEKISKGREESSRLSKIANLATTDTASTVFGSMQFSLGEDRLKAVQEANEKMKNIQYDIRAETHRIAGYTEKISNITIGFR
tara:strand:+ start:10784 stop:11866 length:1083 start_codon:yes stop_codon:yes gene_type:complete